ncbi:MAG: ATP cone domain-containing protein, partial [Cyclobacteriaceae bacterium]
MNESGFTVIKASGDEVPFEVSKLENSLKRAGADDLLADEIAERIQNEMVDGMTTKEIYKRAFRYLKKHQHGMAGRYSLKHAIMELGPAGYPFEKFIARLLEYEGYHTETNLILKGSCIAHEVDVRAVSTERVIFIECKYHKDQGRKSDVKTALYFHSRFRDLAEGAGKNFPEDKEGWLVTNTRFSLDAMTYGQCMGISLISWNYPKKQALKDIVEKSGLHPIT